MQIFIGNTDVKLDEKGRIFIPAHFRKTLAQAGSQRIIMREDPDKACLIMYPESVWESKVEALQARVNEWDTNDLMLLTQFVSAAEIVEMDSQGRILLQKKYLQRLGAEDEVRVVGMMDRFSLWAPKQYEASQLSEEEFRMQLAAKMKN